MKFRGKWFPKELEIDSGDEENTVKFEKSKLELNF